MKKNNNTFVVIILIFALIAILGCGNKAKATSPDVKVWSVEIAHPASKIFIRPTPTPAPTPTPIPMGEQAVNLARQYLGVPYVWGGTTPNGFDCSGLVQYVYKQLGINISRTTYRQVNDGRAVTKDELKAGDLIFFANSGSVHHVGIYIGDGQFIHAPQTGDVVKITNLSDRKDFYAARRIVE